MSNWLSIALTLTISYLLGSIPTGYLAGRLCKGIDIRNHGSKSTGATNVLRTLGKTPALIVLAVDILKGAAAVAVAAWLAPNSFASSSPLSSAPVRPDELLPWIVCLAGLLAILGHARSIWLGFSGGKSAATGLGVLLALSWPIGICAAATFVTVLAVTRIVSLSSMLAAVAAFALTVSIQLPAPYQLLVAAAGTYVIARHRANIQRLLKGTEPRLGQGHAVEPGSQ